MYLHNAPYSGMWEIPYGLGTWFNPVEQPSSAWPTDLEPPEPYSSPSQSYVDRCRTVSDLPSIRR
ncbi:MAG: hypothetical protein J6A23_05355 [Thermoguttaceae bacterium]|nr:hypothetical protein [Thermoguttaceae bacterium]